MFDEVINYLKQFRIFCLVETWELTSDNLLSHFPDHVSFHVNAFKQGMFGRLMCGISLYIHK